MQCWASQSSFWRSLQTGKSFQLVFDFSAVFAYLPFKARTRKLKRKATGSHGAGDCGSRIRRFGGRRVKMEDRLATLFSPGSLSCGRVPTLPVTLSGHNM